MKSKMFKKLMAASLATVMSVGLLACGGEKAQVHFQLFGFHYEVHGGFVNEPKNADCGVLRIGSG